jgi:hypothetical protein
MSTLYDPASEITGIADGTTYDPVTDSRVFDGLTDRLDWESPYNPSGAPISVSMWALVTSMAKLERFFSLSVDETGASAGLDLSLTTSGRVLLVDQNNGGASMLYQTDFATFPTWRHLFWAYTGSNTTAGVRIFMDGVPLAAGPLTEGAGVPRQKAGRWSLGGAISADTVNFTGNIAQPRGWRFFPTDAEVAAYFATLTMP